MKRIAPIDPALRTDLQELLDLPTAPATVAQASEGVLIGRVEDTHNPDLPGRVFVRWTGQGRKTLRAWLPYVLGAEPRRGDSVVLVRPGNDPQWLVSVVLTRDLTTDADDTEAPPDARTETLRLHPGQRLRIESHDGTGLVEVGGASGEVSLRLLGRDLALEAPGRVRLSGTAVELDGGAGGVDVRTEHEVVVRGRQIRLN